MKYILPSAVDRLKDPATNLHIANLLVLELPSAGGDAQYAYYTDYFKDVVYNGIPYISGKIKSISSHKQDRKLTVGSLTISMSGVDNVELDRAVKSGVSFLDRSVTIYQAFIDGATGEIIPMDSDTKGPIKFFYGKITSSGVRETVSGDKRGSVVTWTCSNMFYDFERINGRMTDDASHRGLEVIDGVLKPTASAKRLEYQQDLGFFHSNKSVTVLAKYQAQEKRYKLKSKSSFFGLSKKYSLEEYYVTVTRDVDIDFNLAAKYLPVVYGCRQIPGIPIFADTDAEDPQQVWVVYAFAEGEIEGFLDFSFNDTPMICYDSEDSNDRTCFGRKRDYGDTMHRLASGQSTSAPSVHGQEYKYNDGNGDIRVWTFHGKKDQEAASVMVEKAKKSGFFIQNGGAGTQPMGPEYWDENYKLLDTAYAVVRFTLTENRTDIPQVDATVLGKKVAVYSEDGKIKDDKTSLNGVWQLLDFLTSERYGADVSLADISIPKAIAAAKLLDTQDESYQSIWCTYWRYIGWESRESNNRQIVQMNTTIDTAETVFKITEVLLDSFKGSINNWLGEYSITVEKYDSNPKHIEFNETYGTIELQDVTGRTKYNSVQASIIDPSLAWKTNQITFFNSEFKKQDNRVDKRLNLSFANITNYYCARSMAARELKKSRYSRTVRLELPLTFLGIEVNDNVKLSYERYGWDKKLFLVDSVEQSPTGKLNITLQEYGEDVFINSPQVEEPTRPPVIEVLVTPPRDLLYTPAKKGDNIGMNGVLSWLPSTSTGIAYYTVFHSGRMTPYVITANTGSLKDRLSLELYNMSPGLYTFEVRAVDVAGRRSSPAVITVNIDASVNLSKVRGFKLVNRAPGSFSEWIGPDVIAEWEAIPEMTEMEDLFYRFQFLHPVSENIIFDSKVTNGTRNIYKYPQNKTDYFNLNDEVGVFREGVIRVRAEGLNGEASVQWTYLDD